MQNFDIPFPLLLADFDSFRPNILLQIPLPRLSLPKPVNCSWRSIRKQSIAFWSFFTSENYIKVSDTKEKIFIKPTISRCWNSKKRVQENTGLGGLIKCVQGRFFSSLGAQKACKPLKFIENHSDLLFPWAVTINIYLQELKVRSIKYLWMHFK